MCGLSGVYSSYVTDRELETFKQIFAMNIFRGVDSSGIMLCWRKGSRNFITCKKSLVTSGELIYKDPDLGKILKSSGRHLIAGHTRAATWGSVTEENAQPIEEANIVGCHNGTINRLKDLALKENCSDSRIFLRMIGEEGIDKAIQEVGNGASYALVYVNRQEGTLNFIRNRERPLYFMMSADMDTMYWSSEKWPLKLADNFSAVSHDEPFLLAEDNLVTYRLGQMSFEQRKIRPVEKTYSKPSNAKFLPAKAGDPPWSLDDAEFNRLIENVNKKLDEKNAKVEEDHEFVSRGEVDEDGATILYDENGNRYPRFYHNVKKIYCSRYKGFQGKIIPAVKAAKILFEKGCFLCTKDKLVVNNAVWWISPTDVVCSECRDDPMILHYISNANKRQLWPGELIP